MIQRPMASASAPSCPGLMGSHQRALAAVLLRRGSTTAIFILRSDSDQVTSSLIGVGPKLASKAPVPKKITISALAKSGLSCSLPPLQLPLPAYWLVT